MADTRYIVSAMAQWTGDQLAIELGTIRSLDVRMVAGEVSVLVGPTPRVDAVVEEGPPVEVTLEHGRLTIVHEKLELLESILTRRAPTLSLTVVVPAEAEVSVRTVSAGVMVVGVVGGTDLVTVSGEITASEIGGHLDAKTVSGEIALVRGSVDDVTARTVSGSVTVDVDSVPAASFVTVSGEVTVRLPEGAAFDLDAVTVSGPIDCALPIVARHDTKRRLAGTVAGGGPPIAARTVSGRIALLARDRALT